MLISYLCLLMALVVHDLIAYLLFQEARQVLNGVESAFLPPGGRLPCYLHLLLHLLGSVCATSLSEYKECCYSSDG